MTRPRRPTPEELERARERRLAQIRAVAELMNANRVPVAIAAGGAAVASLSLFPRAGYHVGRGVGIIAANLGKASVEAVKAAGTEVAAVIDPGPAAASPGEFRARNPIAWFVGGDNGRFFGLPLPGVRYDENGRPIP